METTSIGVPKYAFAKFLSSFEVEELIADVTEEWQLSAEYAAFHERHCPADESYGEEVVGALHSWLDKRDAAERSGLSADSGTEGDPGLTAADFLESLRDLGFGTDDPISGADAVDCVNDHLELIRRLASQGAGG